MTAPALEKLTIEHFRGAVKPFTLKFDPSKKLTIIYGENGTGKSTICDALDLLASGQVGSLTNRGLGKTNNYWHSVGKRAADVAVTLEYNGKACRGTLRSNGVTIAPVDARPRVEVLRRAQITLLLEARPGERYEAIRRFVEAPGVEASEAALNDTVRAVQLQVDTALTRVQENRETIHQFWEKAGKPRAGALEWAAQEIERDTDASDLELDAVGYLQRAFERLLEYPAKFESAQLKLDAALAAHNEAATALEQAVDQTNGTTRELVTLLEAAQAHLSKHPEADVCPLCGSAERARDLAAQVQMRLGAFESLRQAQAQVRAQTQAVETAKQQRDALTQLAREHAADWDIARKNKQLPKDTPLPPQALNAESAAWRAWLNSYHHLLARWKQMETERLDRKQFLGTLQAAMQTLNENTAAYQELHDLVPRLQRTLEIVRAERRAFTDRTLARIAAEVGRLYENIHAGETLSAISLELDPKKRASLEIGASFPGASGSPPQAYFSESHLDTLGLCIFIAMAKLDEPANKILALDDILGSVDEPHVDRLVQMLFQEAAHFQHCLITTHYRPWRERLRWGEFQHGECHFVELRRWGATAGMDVVTAIPEVERLKKYLADPAPDLQAIVAKAGTLLEAALDFLTIKYHCAVPRNADGKYTIGEMLPNVKVKLRRALTVEVGQRDASGALVYAPPIVLEPFFERLDRIVVIRNVMGAHYNTLAFELRDEDALEFGRVTLQLVETLMDPQVGWPTKNKSGRYWHTSGETRRLYPVLKPE